MKPRQATPASSTSNSYLIPSDQSLLDVLRERGLLLESNGTGHLVREGELGLCMKNGSPRFLAPGRHFLPSPFDTYVYPDNTNPTKWKVSIAAKRIKLSSIEIVTVNQDELGLSEENGQYHVLNPGRYIFESPHHFVKFEKANQSYINLGTEHRLTIPVGHVAIVVNNGKQEIITNEQTKNGQYIVDSPTFSYDPKKGIKSIQLKETQLQPLVVNNHDNLKIEVIGLIRYRITDPHRAFLEVDDVTSAIKLQAESTLTSVFSRLSIDQIQSSISSSAVSTIKNKDKQRAIPDDFIHQATELFMEEFRSIVGRWGIELETLNILSMKFDDVFQEAILNRARTRMETATKLATVCDNNEIATKEANNHSELKLINAKAEANAMKTLAEAQLEVARARTDAAKIISSDPLASKLAILDKQIEMAGKLGDKTTIIPHHFALDGSSIKGAQNQLLWFKPNHGKSVVQDDIAVRPANISGL